MTEIGPHEPSRPPNRVAVPSPAAQRRAQPPHPALPPDTALPPHTALSPDPAQPPDPAQAPGPAAADPRSAVGRRGEDLALRHLEALGFRAVERNHRTRRGEIDLIVYDGRTLVFVEVKTRVLRGHRPRGGPDPASPLQSMRTRQHLRLRRLVAAWLAETADRPRAAEIRVDAIGIVLDPGRRLLRLDHVEGVL